MILDVHLQTHSEVNLHGGTRYVGAPKSEVMLRSAHSLIRSLNDVVGDVVLRVFDDHSAPAARAELDRIVARCVHPWEIVAVADPGYNASCMASFTTARDRADGLVYLVEDDYLHTPTAVSELLATHAMLTAISGGRQVALHPYDDPANYEGVEEYSREQCAVVHGSARHWRTNTHTTNTCLLESATLRRHWDAFERLARHSSTAWGDAQGINEHSTINAIWREQVALYTPLPSLALHLQDARHRDPFLPWRQWWDAADYRVSDRAVTGDC